jgi:transposase
MRRGYARNLSCVKTTPGMGNVFAATIMLETGTIARFANVGQFSFYCRCVDSKRISNGKKKGEGNTRNGNKYLTEAFMEAAAGALCYCPQARSFYERKKAWRLPVVAMKALAHKLARASYYMMRDGKHERSNFLTLARWVRLDAVLAASIAPTGSSSCRWLS